MHFEFHQFYGGLIKFRKQMFDEILGPLISCLLIEHLKHGAEGRSRSGTNVVFDCLVKCFGGRPPPIILK